MGGGYFIDTSFPSLFACLSSFYTYIYSKCCIDSKVLYVILCNFPMAGELGGSDILFSSVTFIVISRNVKGLRDLNKCTKIISKLKDLKTVFFLTRSSYNGK